MLLLLLIHPLNSRDPKAQLKPSITSIISLLVILSLLRLFGCLPIPWRGGGAPRLFLQGKLRHRQMGRLVKGHERDQPSPPDTWLLAQLRMPCLPSWQEMLWVWLRFSAPLKIPQCPTEAKCSPLSLPPFPQDPGSPQPCSSLPFVLQPQTRCSEDLSTCFHPSQPPRY